MQLSPSTKLHKTQQKSNIAAAKEAKRKSQPPFLAVKAPPEAPVASASIRSMDKQQNIKWMRGAHKRQ